MNIIHIKEVITITIINTKTTIIIKTKINNQDLLLKDQRYPNQMALHMLILSLTRKEN